MKEQFAYASAFTNASRQEVWALLADVSTWTDWAGMEVAELVSPAPSGDPQGVGAVRRLKQGKVLSRELVVGFNVNRRLAYELLEGLPLRDYHGEVLLREIDGRVLIEWRSRFRPPFPGTGRLTQRKIEAFLGDLVKRLAVAAASSSPQTTAA